jgi:hypothetical protein
VGICVSVSQPKNMLSILVILFTKLSGNTNLSRDLQFSNIDIALIELVSSPITHSSIITSFRLVFEIEFVKQLFNDYKKVHFDIWQTFKDTTLQQILADK